MKHYSDPDEFDQSYASLQEGLDELITDWRASLSRKRERHGEKFDSAKATYDLFHRLAHAPRQALASFAAVAVDRLAHMPDYNPVPAELLALDFSYDVQQALQDLQDLADEPTDAPEGGASEQGDSNEE
jgi:hypothetical protein